jgi:bifunctional DNase/RNase
VSEVDAGLQPDPAPEVGHRAMSPADGDQADAVGPGREAAPEESPPLPVEALEGSPADGIEDPAGEPDWMTTAGLEGAEAIGEDWPGTVELEPPEMSQLIFVDVLIVLPSANPVVVLQETESPYRELRIPIGGPEGIAIGYAARRIATPRPLTHELMSMVLRDFDLTLEVVRITGSSGGSFTAEIVVSGASGSRTIDCRPSDAIALALRQRLPVPIMASAGVLERSGSGAAGSN